MAVQHGLVTAVLISADHSAMIGGRVAVGCITQGLIGRAHGGC